MLFDVGVPLIEGFKYERDVISPEEEHELVAAIQQLSFGNVTFRGVEAKRRVVQLGWDYQFASRKASPAVPIPDFLLALQRRAGTFGGVPPESLEEALLTEYQPGAAIGWHRDAPPFGIIVGSHSSRVAGCA